MSIFSDVLSRLDSVQNPVAQVIQKGKDYRVLVLGLKKGMVMKDHTAAMPAILIILEGKVMYRAGEETICLTKYGQTDIPTDLIHSVEALEDSLCILCQGK